jgi:DNA-nicking Smr family endonuclease
MIFRRRNPILEKRGQIEKDQGFIEALIYNQQNQNSIESFREIQNQFSYFGLSNPQSGDELNSLKQLIYLNSSISSHSVSSREKNHLFDSEITIRRTFDFHGFTNTTCKQALESCLKNIDKKQAYFIIAIVGKGIHTRKTKEHVVSNSVSEVCFDLGFPEPIPSEENDGILIITNTNYIPKIQAI